MGSFVFLKAVFEFVLLIFSLSVHECCHAWMASRLGDQTARMQGRVTLNPMYHVDPIGTLMFPAIMIFGPLIGLSMFGGMLVGWAKPTPIISRNFRKIKRDENLVTLAGPFSNLLIVTVATLVLIAMALLVPHGQSVVIDSFIEVLAPRGTIVPQPMVMLCTLAILINLSLFFFNLLPIPPLDGSHILRNILPYGAVQQYDKIGGILSWILMITVGSFFLRLMIGPSLVWIFNLLGHFGQP